MSNMFRSRLGASGGVYPTGNAQPADVLAGKTFSNAEGIDKTGTMVNNGAVTETVAGGQTYTIPEGYHNGSGTVTGEGVPSDMLGVEYTIMTPTNSTTPYPTIIINTSNISSIKFYSANVSAQGGSIVKDPNGTTVATIATGTAESSAITVDVSAYDYVSVESSANYTYNTAYKILS